jgi:hypothetical protein
VDIRGELRELVGTQLRERFPGIVLPAEDEPAFFVALGEIGVRLDIESLGQDSAMVEAFAWIARGLEPSAELGLLLAQRNAELPIGSLCIDASGSIFLQHALLAESVEPSALERVVRYLAHAAETLDAELRERFTT